jgi:hypothetical protein
MSLSPSYVRDIQPAIASLLERSARLMEANHDEPPSGSPLALDLASASRSESIATAVTFGDLALEYAADHLSAFARLLSEPIETLACFTCIRSMLEMSAIGAWVLDPAISTRERIARVFAVRYDAIDQQLKFGRCASVDQQKIADLEQRLVDVEADACRAGYPPLRNKKGAICGIGVHMPGATEMIRDVLKDEWLYRLLSAVAHGHHWAVVQLGFEDASQQSALASVGNAQMKVFRKAVSVNSVALFGLHGFLAFARVLWNKARYSGWDVMAVKSILNDAADSMKASKGVRFWQSP